MNRRTRCFLATTTSALLTACAGAPPPVTMSGTTTRARESPGAGIDAPYVSPPLRLRNVAIVLYPGVELLDFAGPGEVFSSNASFHPYTVAATREPLLSQSFVRITPSYAITDAPKPDIVVIPGGDIENVLRNEAMKTWLARAVAENELTMSVCNGALALADTGALDGLTATTHWGVGAELLSRRSKVTVLPEVRFIDHGRVMTTAGVSAGIDGALHVVQRFAGEESAWRTARYMQYEWTPEEGAFPERAPLTPERREAMRAAVFHDWAAAARDYGALVARMPGDAHARARLGGALVGLGKKDEGLKELERAVADGARDNETLRVFANALHAVHRWDEAAKAFVAWGEASEGARPIAYYDAACALALGGRRDAALDALQKAISAGFMAANEMVTDDDLASLRSEPRFSQLAAAARANEPPL